MMSKKHGHSWLLALAPLLVPAMLEAQAKPESTEQLQDNTVIVETGLLGVIAADTGQTDTVADTTSRAVPDRQPAKRKKSHSDAAADSARVREDAERDQYYSPY